MLRTDETFLGTDFTTVGFLAKFFSPHQHLGFKIQSDELLEEDV